MKRIRLIFELILVAIAFAAAGASFAVLFSRAAKAQTTYGQVLWGQQLGTTTPAIVIWDGTQNVPIGTLNETSHSFSPTFPLTLPSGLTYPSPTFLGTLMFPTGVTMNSPIFTGTVTMPSSASETGTAPTISSCGTGPTWPNTNRNGFGTFTTGTGGPTSCTMTLVAPFWSTACACLVQNQSGASPTGFAVCGSGTVTMTFSAAATSQQFGYLCKGQ